MIQFKLNDFYPPIVFGIEEGLPRVVCDFKNTRADASLKETIKTNGRYVKAIRIGRHKKPDKIRVVIDLEPNNNYDLQQVFFKEDNLFVIIVNIMHNTPPVTELEKPLKQ
ncbi:MAG: AMIN domain-containing protein [Desulfobulbaceae bacterium]|nr:AMIN domain-containing protein [Desulfobulbaceae bacterium]